MYTYLHCIVIKFTIKKNDFITLLPGTIILLLYNKVINSIFCV